jgi:hypothetical protein
MWNYPHLTTSLKNICWISWANVHYFGGYPGVNAWLLWGDIGHCNERMAMCVAGKPTPLTAVGSQVFLTCPFLFLFPFFYFMFMNAMTHELKAGRSWESPLNCMPSEYYIDSILYAIPFYQYELLIIATCCSQLYRANHIVFVNINTENILGVKLLHSLTKGTYTCSPKP